MARISQSNANVGSYITLPATRPAITNPIANPIANPRLGRDGAAKPVPQRNTHAPQRRHPRENESRAARRSFEE
ncbi:MAG: hypothetical protein WCR74_23270, partial [Betaproteobacteria bacterium]